MTLPIFIIVKDRITCLKRSLASFEKLGDVEFILIDTGSTYPPMIEWQRTCGYPIHKVVSTGSFADISEVIGDIIQRWFYTTKSTSKYYVVTDPDIELENPSPALIEYYKKVLELDPYITVVGPMLRIDDLPDHFGLKEDMIKSHKLQFWDRSSTEYDGVKIQGAAIDTTFGLYRRSFKFHRLNNGVRVHEPYMARHLDWYIDTNNLTEEEEYYFNHATQVSSMANHLKRGAPV